MTTYPTETWIDSDPTTDSVATGGCCCGPAADEASYSTEDLGYTEPAAVWIDEAPIEVQDYSYSEPTSVIPAGQPGGPSLAATDPVAFEPTTWASAPAYASTPDPTDAFEPTTWASAPAYSSFVGGNDFGEITILDPSGNPAAPGPSSMVIGPSDPGSAVNSLISVYGIAAQNGDVMSQILVQKTLDSMNRSTLIWTL